MKEFLRICLGISVLIGLIIPFKEPFIIGIALLGMALAEESKNEGKKEGKEAVIRDLIENGISPDFIAQKSNTAQHIINHMQIGSKP